LLVVVAIDVVIAVLCVVTIEVVIAVPCVVTAEAVVVVVLGIEEELDSMKKVNR